MHWIIPALTAPFIGSIINFVDKYLVSRRVPDYRAMPFYTAVTTFFAGGIFWLAMASKLSFDSGIYWGIASGFFCFVSVAVYYYLMSKKDASETAIFAGLTPALVLVLSFLFLGEKISWVQFGGFWLVLAAVMVVSWKGLGSGRIFPLLGVILLLDFSWAVSSILIKMAINSGSFALSLVYEGWGMALGALVFFALSASMRRAFLGNARTMPKSVFAIIGANELLTVACKWVGFYAFSIGPVALVSVAGGAQSFYAIVVGYLLTVFFPRIVAEDISKNNLLKKIVAATLLVAGLYLIYV